MTDTTGELGFIDWLRSRIASDPAVRIGPGDDTALVRFAPPDEVLITTDMLLEGSCFVLAEAGAYRVGRKAMAVNLSDIAAMAGQPRAAVLSVGLPRRGGRGIAEELFRGFNALAEEFGVAIVGGDTNSWEGPLVISVTLFGTPTGKGAIPRSGARPGDWLMATGSFGGSILGKHLDFMPRVREAQLLQQAVDLHAMIDVSDGLTRDITHIAEESRVGAVLFADAIPIAPAANALDDGRNPRAHALGDGEDFELVFCVTPEDGARLLNAPPFSYPPITRIGTIVDHGLWLEEHGQRTPLEPQGYSHDFD